MSKIKLLIVDDSFFVQKVLATLFKNDQEIEVKAKAYCIDTALKKIKQEKFDLVILDYEMPGGTGLEFLEKLKSINLEKEPSVLVLSSSTSLGNERSLACLKAGAKDYIQKPSKFEHRDDSLESFKESLKEKIKNAVKEKDRTKAKKRIREMEKDLCPDLVLIGSSTGGPEAIETVLSHCQGKLSYSILIVQHMPSSFSNIFAKTLREHSKVPVIEVNSETKIEKGKVYLAAGGKHMVMLDNYTLSSIEGKPVNSCIPSVDVTFKSIAENYSGTVLSVILTGMGHDGREGVRDLKNNLRCTSIVQDQESSVVWSMPKAICEAGLSDKIMSIHEIGDYLKCLS